MTSETALTPQKIAPDDRAQKISQSLAASARRLRFTTRGRQGNPDSFRARRKRRIANILKVSIFLLLVAIPTACAVAFFGFVASDQYMSEARFSVRSGSLAGVDTLTALTGIPGIRVMQDTQVVTNYVRSRAMVEHLQRVANFNDVYGLQEADPVSRLDITKPIEKIVKYWDNMVDVATRLPGGTVEIKVKAFRPGDAVKIADAIVQASETLVNEMNDRSRGDAVELADRQLHLAADRLAEARKELEVARNQEGTLDAGASAAKTTALVTIVRGQQLQLQAQYDVMLASTSREAPQMRDLKLKIEAADRQLAQLQAEMTSTSGSPTSAPLSASMTRLASLNLLKQVAETQYTAAAVQLERARMTSMTKQVYLTSFVRPVAAEEARYPLRIWTITEVFLSGLLAWACAYGGLSLAGYT